MTFQFYKPFFSPKAGKWCPGVTANEMDYNAFMTLCESQEAQTLTKEFQDGNADSKRRLPAVCWCGRTTSGKRKASDMIPTQFFLVDIDHIKGDIKEAWDRIYERINGADNLDGYDYKLRMAHITPSGKGIRLVLRATQNYSTIVEHMEWLNRRLHLDEFGDFDTCVKDLSRLSFIPTKENILLCDQRMWEDADSHAPIIEGGTSMNSSTKETTDTTMKTTLGTDQTSTSEQSSSAYEDYEYHGHLVKDIISRYMEEKGEPNDGERHNFYNNLVKNFRCICNNDPKILVELLPRFEESREHRLSQCESICCRNTLATLPKEFFFFLKRNGFYDKATEEEAEEEEDIIDYTQSMPKTLPPIFNQLVRIAPRDFKVPMINSLIPVLGTMTSFLRAEYPFDARNHSTSFISVVYAPPGTGKSYISRWFENMVELMRQRDMLTERREQLWDRRENKRSGNDRGDEKVYVQHRISEPKQSETDFLEKQSANKGHHMLTFCPEIETFAKGVKAAGGNKDDMLRVAWDNDRYGQSFKSSNSFRGSINLYWNVLLTGTRDQLDRYFGKHVSDGLVQRVCFTAIHNQRMADAGVWKKLTKRELQQIENFKQKCDDKTYSEPLNFNVEDVDLISEEDFDKDVPWNYRFKTFEHLDMNWIMPTIKAYLKEQIDLARMEQNDSRDTCRKRVAVRGFRLAMICTQLYEKMDKKAEKEIADFVKWWMDIDTEEWLALWQDEYNDIQAKDTSNKGARNVNLFALLPNEFSVKDLSVITNQKRVKTPAYKIASSWKNTGMVERIEHGKYRKIK